ncbi:MAG: ABC transporter ATP-binding protein [Eubacteriales bacterium]|nr:ABC transporter ATP-binding protein [Eubacteriales bacterium]
MIEIKNVSKSFRDVDALHQISVEIKEGEIFGLVGTNGAGKSTLLRLITGVLQADQGEVLVDGEPVYDNETGKQKICFLPDSAYFPVNATAKTMMEDYRVVYPEFLSDRCQKMLEGLGLDPNRRIRGYSKGMKKQLSVILGICAQTKYLLCDETFDGLDPVIRQTVKSIFATEMLDRDFVPVIASHNLRELEDICDHVGLLHKGGILLSESLDDMKYSIHKVQMVLRKPEDEEQLLAELDTAWKEKRGSILTVIARGEEKEIMDKVQRKDPLFAESLPLSLEEIFVTETEVAGYDVRNIIE